MQNSSLFHRLGIVAAAAAIAVVALPAEAQKRTSARKSAEPQGRLVFAVNEGASGNADAADIINRYIDIAQVIERATGTQITVIAAREVGVVRRAIQTGEYALLLNRSVDLPALAVRDYKYHPVVAAKETGHAFFIVQQDKPIKSVAEIRGRSIVTPEQGSYMWRITNAVLRDNQLDANAVLMKTMRDQAAIGWSVKNGLFDVGVVASYSGVGRNWEKQGGRVVAKSPSLLVTPIIASSRKFTPEQVARMRSALVALDSTEAGAAMVKRIGISGFKEVDEKPFLELLTWLGETK
jgi:ABC-type phosphate/phosphonate transport system substrate-binding protein